MSLDPSTFQYLKPTTNQLIQMGAVRDASDYYATLLDAYLPSGPDKTYVLRKVREAAMWANVALTRHADGAPRE